MKSAPHSRDVILGILQYATSADALRSRFTDYILVAQRWYRVLSPHLEIEVKNATYNESTRELFVEVVQVFHIRVSPLPPVPSRFVSILSRLLPIILRFYGVYALR